MALQIVFVGTGSNSIQYKLKVKLKPLLVIPAADG